MSEALTPSSSAPGQTGIRVPRGEIPQTWRKPAEVVSTLPRPSPRPIASGALVGAGVVACVALAFALAPRASPAAPKHDAIVTHDVAAPPARDAIPAPPATSSTKPGPIAPEDQGGDLDIAVPAAPAPAAPAAAAGPAGEAKAADVVTDGMVGELPARKKARALTARSIGLLRDGDFAGAEPVLVRAVLTDPTYADAWRHLGIARAQTGDKDGARRAYKKYLSLAPGAADAAQVRQILAAP